MNVKINDKIQQFDSSLTIKELLTSLNMTGKPVVVELNKEAIFPRNYESVEVSDGDSLEIITIAAGG